jgi:carbon storage regulator
MLILTRKTDQGIVFAGDVIVRILSVEGERVKIGIDAPRSVQVLREELVSEEERALMAARRDASNDGNTHGDQGSTRRAS